MTIVKKGDKYQLRSYQTGKPVGEYDTIKEARKKLKKIELRKKLRSRNK